MTAGEQRTRDLAIGAAVLVLFVAIRAAMLVARDPFFDELFTAWIVRKPFGEILEALRHDSGPPLYYFLLKLLGAKTVTAARVVSLVCATAAAALLLSAKPLGPMRFAAVLLLAVEPVSVLFSVDARAYALCAMFVAAGIVALLRERPLVAACAFAAAAYSHYYGVFFLATLPRWRAAVLALALFAPGFLLARVQPAEAMQWLGGFSNPLLGLPFAGRYPESLLRPAPWIFVIAALVLLAVAVAREWRFAARFVLIPVALVLAFALIRPVYFPTRFEAVLGIPLVAWIALSLRRWPRSVAVAVVALLATVGTIVSVRGIADHLQRPADPYRRAAMSMRGVPSRVVASGYLYLETVSVLGDRVEAFPREQARHPGWRTNQPTVVLRNQLPRPPFVWIGERDALEPRVLCNVFRCRMLHDDRRVLILSVESRPH